MNRKRTLGLAILIITTVAILTPFMVFATPDCPATELMEIGVFNEEGHGAVVLQNLESGVNGWPLYEARWFSFNVNGNVDRMLAVALTAIATDKLIQMCPLEIGNFAPWSQISDLYILK